MLYQETREETKAYKEHYVSGLDALITARQEQLARERAEYCKNIFAAPEEYRDDFRKMLGWPLRETGKAGLPQVKTTKLAKEDNFTIYRMQFEILDGLEMSGLYFEMDGEKKRPLVIVQHGGQGTPEATRAKPIITTTCWSG